MNNVFTLIAANLATILVSAAVLLVIGLIIMKIIKDKKKGKSAGCGCSCENCASAQMCHKK